MEGYGEKNIRLLTKKLYGSAIHKRLPPDFSSQGPKYTIAKKNNWAKGAVAHVA
jgi:hypothetical protein